MSGRSSRADFKRYLKCHKCIMCRLPSIGSTRETSDKETTAIRRRRDLGMIIVRINDTRQNDSFSEDLHRCCCCRRTENSNGNSSVRCVECRSELRSDLCSEGGDRTASIFYIFPRICFYSCDTEYGCKWSFPILPRNNSSWFLCA